MNEIEISGVAMPIVEYQGQRVVTLAMVDRVHQRPEGTARRTFTDHKDRMRSGEDFYLLDFAQKDAVRSFGIEVPPRGLVILTESGYLMLTKPMTDDRSWEVQRRLVNGYFRAKEIAPAREPQLSPATIAQITAAVVEGVKGALAPVPAPQPALSPYVPRWEARLVKRAITGFAKAKAGERWRSERGAIEQSLRTRLGFHGAGSDWEHFPIARLPELRQILEEMERDRKRAHLRTELDKRQLKLIGEGEGEP